MNDLVTQTERKMSFETLYKRSLDALEKIDDIDTLVDMDNQAEILKQIAIRATEDTKWARNFAEIRVRAQRKMGTIFNKGMKRGNPQMSSGSTFGKLEDLGISRDHSSNCQKIAAPPLWAFEHYVKDTYMASTRSAVKFAKLYLEFMDIVKDKPAKERTALLKKGILGNLAKDDFIELVFPTAKKKEKKRSQKEEDNEPETFLITRNIEEFYENMESFEEYLNQIEELVEDASVVIVESDVDLYKKAVLRYKDSFNYMKRIGAQMMRKVVDGAELEYSDETEVTEREDSQSDDQEKCPELIKLDRASRILNGEDIEVENPNEEHQGAITEEYDYDPMDVDIGEYEEFEDDEDYEEYEEIMKMK